MQRFPAAGLSRSTTFLAVQCIGNIRIDSPARFYWYWIPSMRLRLVLIAAIGLSLFGCQKSGDIVVQVTASYPGANAQTVADTVAAPIEQQINGVERMVSLESESRGDGTFLARVHFAPSADPQVALTLVKNRVALAQPVLPNPVQQAGVVVDLVGKGDDKPRVVIALVQQRETNGTPLQAFADAVLKRISADNTVLKPETFPRPEGDQLGVHIDRNICLELGLPVQDVDKAIQAAIVMTKDGKSTDAKASAEALSKLQIAGPKGSAIPLTALTKIEIAKGPTGFYRVNMLPAVRIIGLPPEGMSATAAAEKCVDLAEEVRQKLEHPDSFEIVNLTDR